jgi:hypothetical protein
MGSSKPVHGVLKRIRWEDPPAPPKKGKPNLYERHAETLRKNPGRWAVVANNVHSSNINTLRKRFPDLEFAFRANPKAEKNPRGRQKGAIYARFPAPVQAPEPIPTSDDPAVPAYDFYAAMAAAIGNSK